ncbi:beta strand repeat-containing protein [Cellulomonas endophytica]|uniref:beta strand repeat-containing protein n=1 Tax=Cellulomonas endophytica TaxID=2494735 RepID=UPI00101281C1|nr:Ig-like domain-containing protein [Cellulomonas endophytica]
MTYTPAPGFRGTDTFGYTVQDTRGAASTATVTITVTNNAPDAVNDVYDTASGTPVSVTLTGNDSDPDSDSLTATVTTGPAHGTVTLAADGTGTYTPAAGWSGTDTFTYTISDGHGGTDTATVTVRVNGSPDAVDDTASTAGDTAVDVTVLGNDSDPDGDALDVTTTTAPTHGAATVLTGGLVRYTPHTGWAGTDTFTYTISDGRGGTDTATAIITAANLAPVARHDVAATGTDTPVTVDVLANDSDANVDAGVPGQQLALTGTPSADHGATVSVGTDGDLTVTPATGYSGPVTVTYTLSDEAGGTATGTLTVTVDNAAPTAIPDGPVHTPTGTDVLIDVLDNDSDANGESLTLVAGGLTDPVDADGHVQGTVTIEAGQVRYVPAPGFAGQVTFEYTAGDGTDTSTAQVTVVIENAPPVADDDTASTPTNTPVTVDVLHGDIDPNIPGTSQVLNITATTADHDATVTVNTDGTLTVTPAAGYKGTVTVTYTVADGAGGTDTGTLEVQVANAAPVPAADTATTPYGRPVDVDVLANDSDPNGDTLTLVPTSVGTPQDEQGTPRGTAQVIDGKIRVVPADGFSGPLTLNYHVSDGTSARTGTLTVTVANTAPVASTPTVATAAVAGQPIVIDVLANVTDPDGSPLRLVAVDPPAHGSAQIADNKLLYTPATDYSGPVTLAYTVADAAGALTTGTVQVEVTVPLATTSTSSSTAGRLAQTGASPALAALVALLTLGTGVALKARSGRARAGRHVA